MAIATRKRDYPPYPMTWEERGRQYYCIRRITRFIQRHPNAPDRATAEALAHEMRRFLGKVYRYQKQPRSLAGR